MRAEKRLETNTGLHHMINCDYLRVLASRVYGSSSNGFWLAPGSHRQPRSRGVSSAVRMRSMRRRAGRWSV